MPPVPPSCQSLADQVAILEAQEQTLRAQVSTLVGAAAWTALASLGQLKQQLDDARAALADCVRLNTAALQGTVAIIYDGAGSPAPRSAMLWDMTPGGGTVQLEVSPVTNDSFAFAGPLPASFGVTLTAAGDTSSGGADFRSAALTSALLTANGPLRVEVVRGRSLRWLQSDLARVAAGFTPITSEFGTGPGIQVRLDVRKVEATLSDSGIRAKASGQLALTSFGVPQSGSFTGSGTLDLRAATAPGVLEPLDVLGITDLQVQLPPFVSGVAAAAVSLVRDQIATQLTSQVRAFLRAELPAAIGRSFALSTLPPDVVVSVNNVSVDASALEFEPALGVIGSSLSTFVPSSVLPP